MVDSRTTDRSVIWPAAAATAVGFGIYSTIKKSGGSDALFGVTRTSDIAGDIADLSRAATQFQPGIAVSKKIPMPDNILSSLVMASNSADPNLIKRDIAYATLRSMMSTNTVGKAAAYDAYREVLRTGNVGEAFKLASERITTLGGDTGRFHKVLKSTSNNFSVFYNPARADWGSKVGLSEGTYNFERSGLDFGQLPANARARVDRLSGMIGEARQRGMKFTTPRFFAISDRVAGRDVSTVMASFRLAGQQINLPMTDTGLTYGGKNLSTRYVTRQAYDETTAMRTFGEEYLGKIERSVLEAGSPDRLANQLKELKTSMVGRTKDEMKEATRMALYSQPDEVATSGTLAWQRLTQRQAVLSGAKPTEELRNRMIESGKLFPIASESVAAKGTMATSDLALDLFGPAGKLFPIEKTPLKFVRQEYGLSAASRQAAQESAFTGIFGENFNRLGRKIKGAGYDEIIQGGFDVSDTRSYVTPQLVTFYAKPGQHRGFQSAELAKRLTAEEMAISKTRSNMLQFDEMHKLTIDLSESLEKNNSIAAALKEGDMVTLSNLGIKQGEFIGISSSNAKRLMLENGELHSGRLVGNNTAELWVKRTAGLSTNDYIKLIGEDVKFSAKAAGTNRMVALLSAAGLSGQVSGQIEQAIGSGIEAVASGSRIGKNAFAQLQQQIEAISIIGSTRAANNQATAEQIAELKSFMRSPLEHTGIAGMLATESPTAEKDIAKSLLGVAQKMNFSEDELGLTFGMMKNSIAGELGIAEAVSSSPGVLGLNKGFMAGVLSEGGAGNRASIEQQALRVLAMKDKPGQAAVAELLGRIVGKTELSASEKMFTSITGRPEFTDRILGMFSSANKPAMVDIANLGADDLVSPTGRMINLGRNIEAFGGANQIYIPGTTEAPRMMGMVRTQRGELVRSPIVRSLETLRNLMVDKKATNEEVEFAAEKLRNKVFEQTMAETSSRGKLVGSKYLRAVGLTNQQLRPDVELVHPETAREMFADLIRSTEDKKQIKFLKRQERRLMAGKEIESLVWRYPTTSPESVQFGRLATSRRVPKGYVGIPYQEGLMQVMDDAGNVVRSKVIDVSPSVGMKLDFDGDAANIAIISSRDTAERLRKARSEVVQSGTETYKQYAAQHEILKEQAEAQRQAAQVDAFSQSRSAVLKAQSRNLVAAKEATGKVNLALQELKLSLMNTVPQEYRRAAETMFHLEEESIGGKHGKAGGNIAEELNQAIKTRNVQKLAAVQEAVLGPARRTVGRLVTASGESIPFEEMWDPMASAEGHIASLRVSGEEAQAAVAAGRAAKGVVPGELNAQVAIFNRAKSSIDPALAGMAARGTEKTMGESVNRAVGGLGTKLSQVKNMLMKNKAGALLGVAAAIGIASLSPSVSGRVPANREGADGGKNLTDDGIGPPMGPGLTPPPARIQESPSVYDISGMESGRAGVRLSMNDSNVVAREFSRHTGRLSNNSNVRIRVEDNRSALSSHSLAQQISERL